MNSSVQSACVVALVLAVVGCGQADGATSSSNPLPTAQPTAATPSDGVVTSIDQLSDGFWQPVEADGAAVDLTEGDFWQFLTRGSELVVVGFDGCNGFGSSSAPGEAPFAIEDGRLVNLVVASEAVGCDDIEYGPYPEDGDLLTLTNDGSELALADPDGTRIQLIRLDEIPQRRIGETPTTGASGDVPATRTTDAPERDDTAEPASDTAPAASATASATSVPAAPFDIGEMTVPCAGESTSDSFDYPEGHQGATTIQEAVDGWTFQGGASYLRYDLNAVVDPETGRAALIDGDGIARILLTVRENGNGWLVESSQRCLDL